MIHRVCAGTVYTISKQFKSDGIQSDWSVLGSMIVGVPFATDEKHQRHHVQQHIKSRKHFKNKEVQSGKTVVSQQFIGEALTSEEIKYGWAWLVLTDQASYMLLAYTKLKSIYCNLKHVTCIVHALHRVWESLKDEYSYVNEFVSCIK